MPVPVAAAPPLIAPVAPIVVRRSFRDAPPFAAGGRRAIRLAAASGQSVKAPCGGDVWFRGRVAGGAPVLTIDCARGGWRVTLSKISVEAGIAVGAAVVAGAVVGTAGDGALGLSVRRRAGQYVDPLPLLRSDGAGG
ncbi:MAG: hypothetical protein QM679_11795, partial [Patulibacter sp.]